MKTLIVMLFALLSFAMAAEEKKDDPIVAVWRGFIENRVIECYPDGSFVLLPSEKVRKGRVAGKWEAIESKSVERKYKLTWFSGQHVHDLTMNKALDRLTGKNLKGKDIEVVKIPNP